MAGRLIPRKSKVQTQFFRNYTLTDAVIALGFIILVALVAVSGVSFRWWICGALALLFVILMINTSPSTKLYQSIGYLVRFGFGRRKFRKQRLNTAGNVLSITPYSGVLEDGLIDYKEYYGGVIEILPVEYYMLTEERQNAFINAVDNALKTLSTGQVAMLVKTERPMVLDKYIKNEDEKIYNIEHTKNLGEMTDLETVVREEIVQTRVNGLVSCNVDTENRLMKDHYYFVTFGSNRGVLKSGLKLIASTIEGGTNGTLQCVQLNQKQTAVFLKNTLFSDIDEREVNEIEPKDYLSWILPDKLEFGSTGYTANAKRKKIYAIAEYPNTVRNAWGNAFFNISGTSVVCKFSTVPQGDAEIRLDRSLMEMEEQIQKRQKASKQIEKNVHYESLQELLISLKSGNETLLDTNIFLICDEEAKKPAKTMLRRGGFKFNELFGSQKDGFINANISAFNKLKRLERGINSSSLAAIFPFISDAVQDEKGIFIGYNTEPFFIDFFERNKERINSNMIVLGKTGSGKSFATKGLLAHLSADNSRIFVLDPEKEYTTLARNLGGKIVDVGSAKEGRINPFQIVTSLEDEGDAGQNVSLAAHLQFLEEFFKVILDGITRDALEVLNECVKELYAKFKITEDTDIQKLKPKDFPIFQNLYEFVIAKYNKEKDDYMKNNLKVIRTYIAKFAEGGRNSNLWNGYSTITADENFIDFNFQTLLSNKNNDIANAQMLLIMRWLENEVFKNKDYNEKYHADRKIIVAIDEAHVFIDEKKPVALDFMFQLAKRIRKYNGMQIVISQNIKDFVGSPEIARKSTAIINASQFSMIFALAPNDINDLVALYEKSGGINESEQDSIVAAQRGNCFFITGPYSRTSVEIVYADNIRYLFEDDRIDDNGNFIDGETFIDVKARREKEKADAVAAAKAEIEREEQERLERMEEERRRSERGQAINSSIEQIVTLDDGATIQPLEARTTAWDYDMSGIEKPVKTKSTTRKSGSKRAKITKLTDDGAVVASAAKTTKTKASASGKATATKTKATAKSATKKSAETKTAATKKAATTKKTTTTKTGVAAKKTGNGKANTTATSSKKKQTGKKN